MQGPMLIQVSRSEVVQSSPEELRALCVERLDRGLTATPGAIREALEIFRDGGTFRDGLLEEALAELAGLESLRANRGPQGGGTSASAKAQAAHEALQDISDGWRDVLATETLIALYAARTAIEALQTQLKKEVAP